MGTQLESPLEHVEADLTCTHNLCFEQNLEKYHNFSSKKGSILYRRVIVKKKIETDKER